MRKPERLDKFYAELHDIHKAYFPDWRTGQLFMNLEREYGDLFYYEEDKMIELIRQYADKYGRKNKKNLKFFSKNT